ncbi:MAG: hypothetical protein NTY96_00620 [Bacteroidetes bacterium]|nr:hypothetical protein [Bacteroidota bacterium]
MKTILSGIIALIIPLFLFAQTAKEAQDLTQVHQKINKIENDNARLKNQVNGVQKSLAKMNEAEITEHLDLAKRDSLTKANQDTVRSYSGRLLKMEEDIAEIEHALMLRSIGFIVIILILGLLLTIRWFTHRGTHRKNLDEVFEKMKAQREEREKRITELRAILEQSESEMSALKQETGDRLVAFSDNLAHVDRNLQTLLNERSNTLEQQIKDGLARLKKDHEEGSREFVKKLEDVQALAASKINELGQKVVDSGKKLDDQITAAHKKTDELKTVLAKEIEAIRSKFE